MLHSVPLDDLPPPPPGSQFVLTDDYSEVFPQTPPEYEILEDDLQPARVRNARPQQSTYLHIFPEDRETYARYHGDPDYRLEDEMPAEEAAAVRRSAAAVPYTSADFDRNNDPFTLTRSLVKVAQPFWLPETFNKIFH